ATRSSDRPARARPASSADSTSRRTISPPSMRIKRPRGDGWGGGTRWTGRPRTSGWRSAHPDPPPQREEGELRRARLAPLVVAAGLGPVAADPHVAPAAGAVARRVQEQPAAAAALAAPARAPRALRQQGRRRAGR